MKIVKKMLKNHKGFSIITVLVAFSFLTLGTYLIFDLTKKQRVQSSRARSVNLAELERNRISSYLSNSDNCKAMLQTRLANLLDPRRIDPNAPFTTLVAGTADFLTTNSAINTITGKGYNTYYNGALNLTFIDTVYSPSNPESGKLVLDYLEPLISKKGASSGRPGFKITIDLHVTVDNPLDPNAHIVDCYAITQTKKIKDVMGSICATSSPGYTIAGGYSVNNIMTYNTTDGVIDYCKYDLDIGGSTCSTTTAFGGFDVINKTAGSVTGSSMKFDSALSTHCKAFTSSCNTYEKGRAISNGQIVCQIPGTQASDPTICTNGYIPSRTSSTSIACINPNCAAGDNFINKLDSAGVSCINVPSSPCPAGTFVRYFNPDGTAKCDPIPVMSGDCGTTGFGVLFKRDDTTYTGNLICSGYSKAKTCPGGYFLTSLDAAGNPSCAPF